MSRFVQMTLLMVWLTFGGSAPGPNLPFALAEKMHYPLSSAVARDGTTYIADRKLPGIWRVSGGKLEVFHRASKRFRTPLNAPWCVAFDSRGRLLVGDSATREVYRLSQDGRLTPLTKGAIGIPICMAADGRGSIYVSDLETQRIWKVSEAGGQPALFAAIRGPRGLAVDNQGRLWAINAGENQLVRFSATGKREVVVRGRPFRFPHGVAVAKDGTAYVTDGYGRCVWKIPPGKEPQKLAADKSFVNPVGITWWKEKLLVTDPRANALFTVSTAGKVETFIGEPRQKD